MFVSVTSICIEHLPQVRLAKWYLQSILEQERFPDKIALSIWCASVDLQLKFFDETNDVMNLLQQKVFQNTKNKWLMVRPKKKPETQWMAFNDLFLKNKDFFDNTDFVMFGDADDLWHPMRCYVYEQMYYQMPTADVLISWHFASLRNDQDGTCVQKWKEVDDHVDKSVQLTKTEPSNGYMGIVARVSKILDFLNHCSLSFLQNDFNIHGLYFKGFMMMINNGLIAESGSKWNSKHIWMYYCRRHEYQHSLTLADSAPVLLEDDVNFEKEMQKRFVKHFEKVKKDNETVKEMAFGIVACTKKGLNQLFSRRNLSVEEAVDNLATFHALIQKSMGHCFALVADIWTDFLISLVKRQQKEWQNSVVPNCFVKGLGFYDIALQKIKREVLQKKMM